jgi:DNA-binding FrmR family transcriptional regulator
MGTIMTDLEKAQEAQKTVLEAIAAVAHAANHERKVLGEKNMNGHYVKALQELEKVKHHVEDLVHRAEARNN